MSESPGSVLPLFARRAPLLSLLRDGPQSKPDLVASLDVSRSTVDRCIRQLESAELAERVDNGFRLTLAGRLLFAEYERYQERAEGVLEAVDLLSVLPVDADIEPAALQGAKVTMADRTAPYRPAESYLAVVKEADHVDHITTALSPQYVEGFRTTVVDEGVEIRLAASESVSRRLVTEYADTLSELFDTDRFTMRELDSHPGYSLGIVDGDRTTTHALVYADDGIRGRIETDHPEAVRATRELFERYWASGTPVARSER